MSNRQFPQVTSADLAPALTVEDEDLLLLWRADGSGAQRISAVSLGIALATTLSSALPTAELTRYIFSADNGNLVGGQTVFPIPNGFAPEGLAVFRGTDEGLLLLADDALDISSGTNIVLTTPVTSDQVILAERYRTFNILAIDKETLGLDQVDNTSDATKAAPGNPIGDALDGKLSKNQTEFNASFGALFLAFLNTLPTSYGAVATGELFMNNGTLTRKE